MRPLVTPAQLANLQGQAARNFATSATILRQPNDEDETSDAQTGKPVPVGTVKGWLTSSPTPEGTVDSGAFVTANTYRFSCPIDTDIQPRDLLDIGDNRYVVTDTTADETWPLMLEVSLRLRE